MKTIEHYHTTKLKSIRPSVYPTIYPCINLCIHLSMYLSIYVSIHPSINASIYPSIQPPITPLTAYKEKCLKMVIRLLNTSKGSKFPQNRWEGAAREGRLQDTWGICSRDNKDDECVLVEQPAGVLLSSARRLQARGQRYGPEKHLPSSPASSLTTPFCPGTNRQASEFRALMLQKPP